MRLFDLRIYLNKTYEGECLEAALSQTMNDNIPHFTALCQYSCERLARRLRKRGKLGGGARNYFWLVNQVPHMKRLFK